MAEETDSSPLVLVRAQVMKRDDYSGGWVAQGGGGLADVTVYRRATVDPSLNKLAIDNCKDNGAALPEFYICGTRVSDNTVMLECTIKKDFEYSKVMPTFHHWVTDKKRYGLTFQTAADARAFDKGVCTAIQELLQDSPDGLEDEAAAQQLEDLPVFDSRSSHSGTSSNGNVITEQPSTAARPVPNEGVIISKHAGHTPPGPARKSLDKRVQNQCRHCYERYYDSENHRGACESGPDCFRSCIYACTCIRGVECVTYHCLQESEFDSPSHPCTCRPTGWHCVKRWTLIAATTIVAPCLLCYPPLHCMNVCTRHSGLSGRPHVPMFNNNPPGGRYAPRPI